jgi:prophage tail gpP-like protein
MADDIHLFVGGFSYSGWERVRICRSIEAVAGSFDLTVANSRVWPIASDAKCELRAGIELVISGFVDSVNKHFDDVSHTITVRGRDATCDLVDCSAAMTPGEWYDLPLERIVHELALPLGIKVATNIDTGPFFDRYAVQPGETVFAAIERACRLRGVLPQAQPDGSLLLTRPGLERATVSLEQGVNVSAANLSFDRSAIFHDYFVRAQQPNPDDDQSAEDCAGPEGNAQDLSARFGRSLVIMAEGIADDDACDRRAEWEASVRAARASKLEVTLPGWRQGPNGGLWTPGILTHASLPALEFDGELLVQSVVFTLGIDDGQQTELCLVRPDAYKPVPVLKAVDDPANFGGLVER